VYEPFERVTLRASYSETVARQTFKELTPILQQEYLGGPIFIGNPELGMSALQNYDLRADYTPYDGALLSFSWFHKEIEDPIEYVPAPAGFTFTTPRQLSRGQARRLRGRGAPAPRSLLDSFEGFAVGANASFIDSQVTLPDDEIAIFENLQVPMTTRDMTNAPDHLYNVYLTYDIAESGTQSGSSTPCRATRSSRAPANRWATSCRASTRRSTGR
jgi:outer membrane receptor protein involved in Fe transport